MSFLDDAQVNSWTQAGAATVDQTTRDGVYASTQQRVIQLGAVVPLIEDKAPPARGALLTKAYAGSGYVLLVPRAELATHPLMRAVGPPEGESGPLWRRLAWFVAIAAAAGLATAVVAYGLRAMLVV